jgi:hypothetical protein
MSRAGLLMEHKHKVEFPQFDEIKEHVRENQTLYLGIAAGILLGYYLKGKSCETRVLLVYTMSS